jgi:hypothetical protein
MKFALYSGLEDNILTNLIILGIMDRECFINEYKKMSDLSCVSYPILSSNIIYELEWDSVSLLSYVSVSYNGVYYAVCDQYENENPKKSCEFGVFKEFVGLRVNPNWEQLCNYGVSIKNFNGVKEGDMLMVEFLFIAITFLMGYVVLVIMWKWKIND